MTICPDGNYAKKVVRKSARNNYIFLPVIVFAFLFLVAYLFVKSNQEVVDNSKNLVLPTPTPKIESNEVHSEDGTLKVSLDLYTQQNKLPVVYIYTSDVLGANKKLLFSKSLEAGENISLPPNSWSPDNNFLFISDWKSNNPGALVFKASGEQFANGEPYLDISSLFAQQKRAITIRDITGWDSPTLIHVQTWEDPSTKGPNFWFDVESKAFLQLAS